MTLISTSTLAFLQALKENNNRDWFHENKKAFETEQQNAKQFFTALTNELRTHDDVIDFKLFRIFRDVRFSKDKTPYQPHFAGYFARATNRLRGSYYLRIRPGESFLAGGFWGPNTDDLYRIRKEFEADASGINAIITNSMFKEQFGDLIGKSLKTAPRGFDKEHPAIDLIKMKQFIVKRTFTDEEVLSPHFFEEISKSYKAMRPYFNYMSEILTTNLNGETIID